eukprot:scaffold510825_cov17-Prasinocladus_malaysianus.AAC.1
MAHVTRKHDMLRVFAENDGNNGEGKTKLQFTHEARNAGNSEEHRNIKTLMPFITSALASFIHYIASDAFLRP